MIETLLDDQYAVSHSGNGLDVDNGQGKYGWYFIRCARNDECSRCVHLKGFLLLRCGLCGCALKGKTLLLSEKCPAGKW